MYYQSRMGAYMHAVHVQPGPERGRTIYPLSENPSQLIKTIAVQNSGLAAACRTAAVQGCCRSKGRLFVQKGGHSEGICRS
eukprot:365252-Chlamydomonas_euryale.AAC.54